MMYSYNKTNQTHQFLKFILGIELHMFRTVSLYVIRSLVLHTHRNKYMYVCMYVCMCIYVRVCVCVCVCVCVYIYIYIYICRNWCSSLVFFNKKLYHQTVSRRPLTAQPGFEPRSHHVGLVVDKVALGQGFSQNESNFPCQCHSTDAPSSSE